MIGIDGVQASEELEGTHKERSGGRTAFWVGQPDIDASRLLIHFDDLARPAVVFRFILVNGNCLRGSPVECFDVPGTESDCTFPGPIELHEVINLQGEDRLLCIVRYGDYLATSQLLAAYRVPVFLTDRL
jgi:hypothetical protein